MNSYSILPMIQPRLLVEFELILSDLHLKDYSMIFWTLQLQLSELSKYFLHNKNSSQHMDTNLKLELLFLSHPIHLQCILHYSYYLKCIRLKIAKTNLYCLIVFHSELNRTPQQLLSQKPNRHHNSLDPQHQLQSQNLSNRLKLELLLYLPQVFLMKPSAIKGQFAKSANFETMLQSNQQSY